jgi:hypothetical protein
MMTRARWSALFVGVAYVGAGVLGWLRSEAGAAAPVPTAMIVAGLWGAIAILAVGLWRPDIFQLTTRETGSWLAVTLAAPLTLLPYLAPDLSTLLLVALWPLSVLPGDAQPGRVADPIRPGWSRGLGGDRIRARTRDRRDGTERRGQ